jgi:hypothetical protein
MTRAARQLGVTQPALSAMVRKLEAELGAPLLDRTGKGVALTDAGKVFLQHAEAALREADAATRSVRELLGLERGTIRVGDREWEIDGHGLRDHSWGPRYWQAPWYYRWLTANVDQNFGFMASRVAKKDGPGTRGGFVWENGQMHYCDDVSISTETRGDDAYHQRITGLLRSSRSGKEWAFTGEVMDLIPLRNRRQDPDGNWLMTRISEGMTKWTIESGEYAGKVGYGLSEYLDQIIDGQPVGLAE